MCVRSDQVLELSLASGEVVGFESVASLEVACVEGAVWITAPKSDDIILDAEESVRVSPNGRIVIQALSLARFKVQEIERLSS